MAHGEWYWRIVARNRGGFVSSEAYSLTIEGVPPRAFALISPNDGLIYPAGEQPVKLDWKEVFGAKIYKAYLWQGEVVASRTILEAQYEDHKLGFSVRFDPTQLSFYQVSADVDHTPIANAPWLLK